MATYIIPVVFLAKWKPVVGHLEDRLYVILVLQPGLRTCSVGSPDAVLYFPQLLAVPRCTPISAEEI